jgi:putative membrane protein
VSRETVCNATGKASNAEVKQFGQRMMEEHRRANPQLSCIAQQKNVQVPTALAGKARDAIRITR